jgi:hypothetical protein
MNNAIKASIFVHNKIVDRRFLQRLRTTGQKVIKLTHVGGYSKITETRYTFKTYIYDALAKLENNRSEGHLAYTC